MIVTAITCHIRDAAGGSRYNTTLLLLLLRSLLVTCIVKLVCSMYGIYIILGLVFLKNYDVFLDITVHA